MQTQTALKQTQSQPQIHDYLNIDWEHEEEPDFEKPTLLHLFTISGHLLIGYWQGFIGEHYAAWAPLYPSENHVFH